MLVNTLVKMPASVADIPCDAENAISSLENDVMATSKRCAKFLSLIFILKCLSKFNLIRI